MASSYYHGSSRVDRSRKAAKVATSFLIASLLTHFMGLIQPSLAGTTSQQNSETSASSSQPLWSYQVKPNTYVGSSGTGGGGLNGHYTAMPSLFDAFNGLSQRQGALTSSPLMTILPIILIAAGGLLLLLPMFTMMLASPFGGGGGPFGAGGYQNFGYPQVGALNKRRSLGDLAGGPFGQRGVIDLIEHVSTTIEELTKKYTNNQPGATSATASTTTGQQNHQLNKRAKSLNFQMNSIEPPPAAQQAAAIAANQSAGPANHKQPASSSAD